jgi:DNA-binding NarL/FixJ family response regulator
MNTSQLERIEKTLTSTLCPLNSYALGKIKNNRSGISVFDPQTVMIRAIDFQKWQQIVNNPLTERELCVLKMIVDGKSNPTIAEELYLTVGTIKTHVRNILRKMDVTDRTQATVLALRSGLVD